MSPVFGDICICPLDCQRPFNLHHGTHRVICIRLSAWMYADIIPLWIGDRYTLICYSGMISSCTTIDHSYHYMCCITGSVDLGYRDCDT